MKYKRVVTLLLLVLLHGSILPLYAQDTPAFEKQQAFFAITDSNQLSARDYASRIEEAFLTLNKVQDQASVQQFSNVTGIIATNSNILSLIDTSFRYNANINPKDLQLYLRLLDDATEKIQGAQEAVKLREKRYRELRNSINQIARDPLINRLTANADFEVLKQLQPLRYKWFQTDSLITEGMKTVDKEIIQTSSMVIRVQALHKQANSRLLKNNIEAFSATVTEPPAALKKTTGELADASRINGKIFIYYIGNNLLSLFWLPVLLIAGIYYWVRRKLRIVAAWENGQYFEKGDLKYMVRHSLLAVVLLVLSILPLIDIYAPLVYSLLAGSIGIFLFYALLARELKEQYRIHFICLCIIGLAVLTSSGIGHGSVQLMLLYGISISGIIAGSLSLTRRVGSLSRHATLRYLLLGYGLLSIVVLLLILTGRITLAQNVCFAGFACFMQLLCLLIVKRIILELVKLQLVQKRIQLKLNPYFRSISIARNLQMPLNIIIAFMCMIVFATNVNIYTFLRDILDYIFAIPIHVGSANFKVGSILFFLIIVLIAHFLKKHIGYVFGDTGDSDDEDGDGNIAQTGLVITRLLIICLGYMLAVAASGLPVEKITIVLGALGVGVGMGLQNIVNNFVSGIILLFERPLKIGDNVALNGKSGKVKEMGIRTSTLLTEDGAEVIIPNGTILSQDITNWSFSNNKRRIELLYSLGTKREKDEVISAIINVIAGSGYAISYPRPSVFLDGINLNELRLRVYFWCKDSNEADLIKTEVRYLLYQHFRDENIEIR